MNVQGKKILNKWLLKIKCRNIQSIQHARMNHAYCAGLNPGWKKIRLQLALKTFCPNPQPLTHRQLKQHQRTEILKKCFLPPNKTKTNQHQLNHLQTLHTHTHTKLHHLARDRSEGKLSNPWSSKTKSWTHLSSSFHLIKTRKRKIKRQIHPACSFRSATPTRKRQTHLLGR